MQQQGAPVFDGASHGAGDGIPVFAEGLAAVWRAACGPSGATPRREALTPGALFPLLPFLAMIDLPQGGPARISFVGNGLKERLGGDPGGRAVAQSPLAALLPEPAETALRAGTPWHIRGSVDAAGGRAEAQACLFPLADDAGRVATAVATVHIDPP